MSSSITDQIARATERLAQLKAREMLRTEKAKAKARALARREDAHRKILLGGLVIAADCGHIDDEGTLVGMLLDARARINNAEWRAQMRERGIQHLEARKAERDAAKGK